MEKIFLFNISDNAAKDLTKTAGNMRIKTINVSPQLFSNTLGDIVDGKALEKDILQSVKDGLLVFDNVSDRHMDKILATARKYPNEIPYKSIVTPTNRQWNIAKLLFELEKERKMY